MGRKKVYNGHEGFKRDTGASGTLINLLSPSGEASRQRGVKKAPNVQPGLMLMIRILGIVVLAGPPEKFSDEPLNEPLSIFGVDAIVVPFLLGPLCVADIAKNGCFAFWGVVSGNRHWNPGSGRCSSLGPVKRTVSSFAWTGK